MALSSTIWPNIGTPPEAIKAWLSTFYRIADTKDSSVIEQIVDLFSEDAIVKTAAGQIKGKEGLSHGFIIVAVDSKYFVQTPSFPTSYQIIYFSLHKITYYLYNSNLQKSQGSLGSSPEAET
jgi:hypothetical protein